MPQFSFVRRVDTAAGGNALIEFALVFPLLLLVIFGLIGFGQALWTQSTLNYAVQTAVRCVQIDHSPTTPCPSSQIASFVANNAPGLDPTQLSVSQVSCGPNLTQVSATYPFTFTIPGISFPTFNMSAQACYPT